MPKSVGITEPWERLPDESAQAYAAALAYFKLGPNRSLDAVGCPKGGVQKGAKRGPKGARRPGHVQRWCQNHNWVERAAAWDASLTESEARAQHEAIRRVADQEARDWAEWRSTFAKNQRNIYTAAYQRYMELVQQHQQSKAPDSKAKPVSQAEFTEALKAVMLASEAGREALSIAAPLMPDSKGDQQQLQPATLTTDEAAAAMKAVVEQRRAANSQEKSR